MAIDDNDNEVMKEIYQQDEHKTDGKKEEPEDEEPQARTDSYHIVDTPCAAVEL
jgi:hypothetical protein